MEGEAGGAGDGEGAEKDPKQSWSKKSRSRKSWK